MVNKPLYKAPINSTGVVVLTREQMELLCSVFAVARNTEYDRALKMREFHGSSLKGEENRFMKHYHDYTHLYYEVIEPQWWDTVEESH